MKEDSEFVALMRDRFEEDEMSYNDETTFLFLINAPDQYDNEAEMLKYAKEHPEKTMQELIDYWDSITPDGLPPGMDPEELVDDEDE